MQARKHDRETTCRITAAVSTEEDDLSRFYTLRDLLPFDLESQVGLVHPDEMIPKTDGSFWRAVFSVLVWR